MKNRKCNTTYSDYFLEIETNCLPNYMISMSVESENTINIKIPIEPIIDPTGFWGPYHLKDKNFLPFGPIGVCINGVPFFSQEKDIPYSTPEVNYFYNQLPSNICVYESDSPFTNLSEMIINHLENNIHSSIIGFAFDGFPIYGPLGWDSNNKVKIMSSSYQDKEYIENLGDLDICNGINSPTPEYPDGIYHYHATIQKTEDGLPVIKEKQVVSVYPHLIARFKGMPETRNFIDSMV